MPNVCKVCGWSTSIGTLTKHFCKSSNTCGSSTHFANIWHADKTEVVNVPLFLQKCFVRIKTAKQITAISHENRAKNWKKKQQQQSWKKKD